MVQSAPPDEQGLRDKLTISGLSSALKAEKRVELAKNLADVADVRVETELKIGREGTPRAAQQNAGINPCRRGRRREVTEGHMRPAQFIQNSLFPMVVGTGIEFGGHNGRQDGALEDPSVLAQPQIALSPAEADVNASIEQEGTSQAASARWLFFLPLSASMV